MTKASDNDFPSVLLTEQSSAPSNPASGKQRAYIRTSDHALVTVNSSGTVTPVGSAASGSITASGYTQNTAKLLGRTTGSSGAIEEISVGSGLTLSAGSLSASGGGGGASLNMVQWKQASGNTSLTLTMGATPTSGNIIVLGVVNNGTADLTSVTQTNVTWTKIKSGGTPDGPTKVQIWVGKVSGSAGTTVTIVRPGGNAAWSVVEYAFSGTVTPSLGQSAASSAFLGAATDPLLMAATTAGNLIVFMAGMVNQNQGVRMWPSLPTKGIPLAMAAIQCALSDGGTVAFAALDINASAQGGGMLIAEVT